MISDYIQTAMRHAEYETLPEGEGIFGHISQLPGVWANEETLEAVEADLRDTLESWLVLALARGAPIPPIDGVELAAPEPVAS